MLFNVSAIFDYEVREASTLILGHYAHPEHQRISSEWMTIEPLHTAETLISYPENNRLNRINIAAPMDVQVKYSASVETFYSLVDFSASRTTAMENLPVEVFPYLYPSRYCQADLLTRFAVRGFDDIENPFEKVLAITDWIYQHVEYLSGSTNSETSAYDTVTQQAGVCRDFAHLGIALCRALTIPARYCAVYAYRLVPQDFHACFEAYIDNKWVIFDATRLAPLNGLVKIAVGRDVAETAVSNLYGDVEGKAIEVDCQCTADTFTPLFYDRNLMQGLVYHGPGGK